MTTHSQTIYGETVEDLLPALVAFADAVRTGAEGMFHASVALAPREGLPLQRAMMRAEASLMLEEADRIGSQDTKIAATSSALMTPSCAWFEPSVRIRRAPD